MATASDLRRLAMALEGTTQTPHFDRAAFRVSRNYATLAADHKSANLKLLPDEQALIVEMHVGAFTPVAGKWGEQGWTTVQLAGVSNDVLTHALQMAWRHALPKTRTRKAR